MESKPKKYKWWIWLIVIIVIMLALYFSDFIDRASRFSHSPDTRIGICTRELEAERKQQDSTEGVVPARYACAVKEASTIYSTDKFKAIELCVQYSWIPKNITSGSIIGGYCDGDIQTYLKKGDLNFGPNELPLPAS